MADVLVSTTTVLLVQPRETVSKSSNNSEPGFSCVKSDLPDENSVTTPEEQE